MSFKLALITGASSGIGESLAQLVSSKGVDVALSGRNREKLRQVADAVKAKYVLQADLQDTEQRGSLVRWIWEKRPDLLINCAGFGLYGDVFSLTVNQQLAILEVNAAAPLELMLEASRALAQAGEKGVVINISSVAGEHPCPGLSVYGGAKAFLTNVSQALNEELKGKGIHVLVSCPGMVDTDFANRAAGKLVKDKQGPILSPNFVAENIWKQIEKRKEKHVINWQYRLSSFFAAHFVPVSFVKKMIWKRIKNRI